MGKLHEDLDWKARWEERGQAIRRVLGETSPPGVVIPFAWKEYILPGACALTFEATAENSEFLYMTLGLTQPLIRSDAGYPWEFTVRTLEPAEWAVDLLYQLTTQWLWSEGRIGFGHHLPLLFFSDLHGKIWGGLTDDSTGLAVVGLLRGLYLWKDHAGLQFKTSEGEFGLLNVVGVTQDEDQLALETTPAHLLLLLRRMGVKHSCDPLRRSVCAMPNSESEWETIRSLSHDDAYRELQVTV